MAGKTGLAGAANGAVMKVAGKQPKAKRAVGKKVGVQRTGVKKGVVGKVTAARMTNATRRAFLAALSESSNVAASARAAGVSSGAIYAERRKSPAFRGQWEEALAEGYARLEADLLAEALQAASGKVGEATLKSRAQKHRLALALLNAHRATVKQAGSRAGANGGGLAPMGGSRAELLERIAGMKMRSAALAAGEVAEGSGDGVR